MKKGKLLISILTCTLLSISSLIYVKAAGASISGGGNVTVGDTVTVTINAGDSKSWAYGVSYSGNLELLSGSVEPMGFEGDNPNNTLQFRATQAGSGYVSFAGQVSDGTKDINVGNSVAVNVSNPKVDTPSNNTPNPPSSNQPVAPQTPQAPKEEDKRSTDNTLSSLSVSGGELSPAFSAGETAYSVSVPAETTKVTIDAKANDGKATVAGTGEREVKAGKNEFAVTVTAENGTSKEYKVTVMVDEKPLVFTEYGENKLGVVRNLDEVKIPTDFNETTVKLGDQDVKAWKNDKLDKTIVYLVDEQDNKGFYLYEDGKITTSFTYRTLVGREFFIIDIPSKLQKITGMTYQQLTIDEVSLMGWVFDDPALQNYQVIYVMDMDGNMQYYQYEITQNSLQLYSHAAAMTQETYEKEQKSAETTKMMLIGATVFMTLVAIGGVGFALYTKKKSVK